ETCSFIPRLRPDAHILAFSAGPKTVSQVKSFMSMFRFAQPAYPEEDIKPMREELEAVGATSLRSAEQVDAELKNPTGTALLVVNSVCGCAAGGARPGVSAALQN